MNPLNTSIHYNKQFWQDHVLYGKEVLQITPKKNHKNWSNKSKCLSITLEKLIVFGQELKLNYETEFNGVERERYLEQIDRFYKLSTSYVKHVVTPFNNKKKQQTNPEDLEKLVSNLKELSRKANLRKKSDIEEGEEEPLDITEGEENNSQYLLEDFPDEIKMQVISYLGINSKAVLSQTSKYWFEFLQEDLNSTYNQLHKNILDGNYQRIDIEISFFKEVYSFYKDSIFGAEKRLDGIFLVERSMITGKKIKKYKIDSPFHVGFKIKVSDEYIILSDKLEINKPHIIIDRKTGNISSTEAYSKVIFEGGFFYVERHGYLKKFKRFDFKKSEFSKLKFTWKLEKVTRAWSAVREFLIVSSLIKNYKTVNIVVNTVTGKKFKTDFFRYWEDYFLEFMNEIPFLCQPITCVDGKKRFFSIINLETGREIKFSFGKCIEKVFFKCNMPHFIFSSEKKPLFLGILEDFSDLNTSKKIPKRIKIKNPDLREESIDNSKKLSLVGSIIVCCENEGVEPLHFVNESTLLCRTIKTKEYEKVKLILLNFNPIKNDEKLTEEDELKEEKEPT